jgi:hypothetical protein
MVEPWLSLLNDDNATDDDDHSGSHSMTKSFFEYYSAPAGRPWTREECEAFFNDDSNFHVRQQPLNIEKDILEPAGIGRGSVFSLNSFNRRDDDYILNYYEDSAAVIQRQTKKIIAIHESPRDLTNRRLR